MVKGFNLQKGYNHLKSIQAIADENFLRWQESQKWSIVNYHFEKNPAFRKKLNDSVPVSWEDIPVMTKKDLQVNLNEILTPGIKKNDLYISNTSGSSGHPFFFAKNKDCHSLTWGIIKERYELHGIKLGEKQARFYGIPLTAKENIKERLKDFFANRVRFPVFDLSDSILETYLERFKSIEFKYIYGYTSAILLFARFIQKKQIVLKNVCPSLTVCIVTSEMCSAEDKRIMQIAFGCTVVNEYGASELDFIAIEDNKDNWIVTEESLFIEILDDNNLPVLPGHEGKVVITSLFNKAMPFIRYEIGDMGILSTTRKGKYRILESLTGRTNDFAVLPSGRKAAGLTFYYISKSLLEADGVMKEFIIKQINADTFLYEYVSDRELNESEIKGVIEMMDIYLEPGLKVEFSRKSIIERYGSGKLKHFHSLLK
ncbi:MAG: hypothetical protein Q8K64_13705 [Sediminibacterium sp.]|nr:hypothetical protein [Sediminibacterium sp.]